MTILSSTISIAECLRSGAHFIGKQNLFTQIKSLEIPIKKSIHYYALVIADGTDVLKPFDVKGTTCDYCSLESSPCK